MMESRKFFNRDLLKKTFGIVLFVALMTFLCIRFYSANIASFPSTIHAWAQADRYALALNFQKNGFDLFHPQTFSLRPQFPAKEPQIVETGITQVDCPLHDYMIAIIMTTVGNNSPFVFRLYNLLYGILGLFFLFLLVRNNTQSQLKSLAVVLFAFLSPVVVYYLDGFLPSSSSLASALIGYYFYFEYRKNKHFRDLVLAVLFATIAALSRTPFTLFLAAMGFQLVFDMFKNRKADIKIIIPFIVAFGMLLSYFIYNRMLARAYGSVFLTHLMPVSSFAELKQNLVFIYQNWFTSYLTAFHYIILLMFGLAFLIQRIKKRRSSDFQKNLLFQILITFSVSIIYFVLMVKQFHSHDYYFLDSFCIPLILVSILFMDSVELKSTAPRVIFFLLILLFGYFAYGKCRDDMALRYAVDPNNRSLIEVNNFSGSKEYLDSMGIGHDSKILVIEAYSANIPLILMGRKGYTLIGSNKDNITEYFSGSFDFVVMQNEIILAEVINYYPEIIDQLEPFGSNGKISVFKKQFRKKRLPEFLQIKKDNIIYCESSCETMNHSCGELLTQNVSCDSMLLIGQERDYGDILETDLHKFESNDLSIIFSADCRLNAYNHDNTDLVATLNDHSGQVYYKSYALNQYLANEISSDFRKLYFMFQLPSDDKNRKNLKLYIWNNGKNELELKNIGIWILDNPN